MVASVFIFPKAKALPTKIPLFERSGVNLAHYGTLPLTRYRVNMQTQMLVAMSSLDAS